MYLILLNIFNGKVEPEARSWPARVRPDEQVVLQLGDVVGAAQVAALEGRVEAQLAALRLAALARRTDDHPAQVTEAPLSVAFVAIYMRRNE